jgi:hypothetical protein
MEYSFKFGYLQVIPVAAKNELSTLEEVWKVFKRAVQSKVWIHVSVVVKEGDAGVFYVSANVHN